MTKKLVPLVIVMVALAFLSPAFAQSLSTDQQRIVEPIIIHGQQAQGSRLQLPVSAAIHDGQSI